MTRREYNQNLCASIAEFRCLLNRIERNTHPLVSWSSDKIARLAGSVKDAEGNLRAALYEEIDEE